jgi:hypothetical protein
MVGSAPRLKDIKHLQRLRAQPAMSCKLKALDKFAGAEITDDDVEQIQLVGDLIRNLNATKQVKP